MFASAVGFMMFGFWVGEFGFSFGNCSCVVCFVGCFTCNGFVSIAGAVMSVRLVICVCLGWLF